LAEQVRLLAPNLPIVFDRGGNVESRQMLNSLCIEKLFSPHALMQATRAFLINKAYAQ
jgi:hypothetical protein